VQHEPAAEGLDAVGEADQAGAAGEVGAAAPVVANVDVQDAAERLHLDFDAGGRGVLGRVGQRRRDDVVGGELDRAPRSTRRPPGPAELLTRRPRRIAVICHTGPGREQGLAVARSWGGRWRSQPTR
jgi:hypothetical protein